MKKRLFSLVCAALLLAAMALPAGADTGPKPSVEVAILALIAFEVVRALH